MTNIEEKDLNFELFFIDVETTGCRGVTFSYPDNKIIQISCLSYRTKNFFNILCNPGDDIYIPPMSIKEHRITREDIVLCNAPSTEDGIKELEKWIKIETGDGGRDILFVAHNADFDRRMILKNSRSGLGINAKKLKWYWYDTLKAFKKYFPELQDKYHPVERPHSLETLMEHFFPSLDLGAAHNAEVDVNSLKLLFIEQILPRDLDLHHKNWPVTCTKLLSYIPPTGPLQSIKNTYLKDIRGFGPYRCRIVCDEINRILGHKKETLIYKTTPELITAAHLILFGQLKYNIFCKQFQRSKSKIIVDNWFFVCREIEKFLRIKLKIYSDTTILELLTFVTGRSHNDLVYHTMQENGKKSFFPTMPGNPISYLPFKFENKDGKVLYKTMGLKTASDIYCSYTYTHPANIERWKANFTFLLQNSTGNFREQSLKRCFEEITKYG